MPSVKQIIFIGLLGLTAEFPINGFAAPAAQTASVKSAQVGIPGAATPVGKVKAPEESFTLEGGSWIVRDLRQWGSQSGWKVVWRLEQRWSIPNTYIFHGSFHQVCTKLVHDLRAQGVNIHAQFFNNNTVVFSGTGVH